ncbi:MAG: hypothetical protein ACI90V_011332, partial [Bacillariaceae sp.]
LMAKIKIISHIPRFFEIPLHEISLYYTVLLVEYFFSVENFVLIEFCSSTSMSQSTKKC